MNEEDLALLTARTAADKKGENIMILKMAGISLIADYFMICHGNSEKQVQAIADAMKETAADHDIAIKRMEGFDSGRWILVDFEDVIVHVFHKEERDHYQLEKLWGDAPVLNMEGKLI